MTAPRSSYWSNIVDSLRSLRGGLSITLRHLLRARKRQPTKSITDPAYFVNREGIATIQYPYEMQPVPDNGRYRLHNEIDDCIVCDKCAKVCPVNCIDIEPVKAVEEIGKTSDGTSKRIYAARFDIDMGKCCFCGLCTTVCPTECLTMTKVYDFSVTDIREHNYAFGEMTAAEIADKKQILAEHQKAKAAPPAPATTQAPEASAATSPDTTPAVDQPKPAAKPVFRPKIKPAGPGNAAPPSPPPTPAP